MLGDPLSQLLYAKARRAAGYGPVLPAGFYGGMAFHHQPPVLPRVPPQIPGGHPGPQPMPPVQPLPSDITYYIKSRLSQGLPVGPDYSWDAHDAPPGAHIVPRPNI